jgi:magnesium-transporting ATPase (P-type)
VRLKLPSSFERCCPSQFGAGNGRSEMAPGGTDATRAVRPADRSTEPLALAAAAQLTGREVVRALGSSRAGLTSAEAGVRLERIGPNALRTHGVRAIAVFLNQLRSPFLLLLLATAVASIFFGEGTDALIIFLISGLSVGLGFVSDHGSGTRSSRCGTARMPSST